MKSNDASPYLVFLINFEEPEFECVEQSLLEFCGDLGQNLPIVHMKGENLRRSELYLKGGIFCLSFKQLVLDLLCKKVSPLIITGLIVNSAHKCHREADCETFLIKMVKREN